MVDCKDAPPAIFLMGPTASGKTNLAMQLYDKIPCELISVDSALIYRDMNIGTAKPTRDELEKYPHHLVNIIDPSESYSAAQFRIDTLQLMEQITARGNTPVLVGGTMMYFNALRHGLASLPQADDAIRQRITDMAAEKGWPSVHSRLSEVDPESAARLEVNDSQRVQRALEVFELTGVTLTEHWAKQKSQTLPYNVLSLAVMPADRKILHERIQLRFNQMLQQGFEEEVRSLFSRGDLNLQMPSMRCVGYRQMWMYLTGEYDFETMRDKGVIATRQLAKRQVTWLRSWDELHWLDPQATDLLNRALKLLDSSTI